jgi:hypothetical protein
MARAQKPIDREIRARLAYVWFRKLRQREKDAELHRRAAEIDAARSVAEKERLRRMRRTGRNFAPR